MASDICQQLIDRGLIGPDQLTEAEGVARAQGIRAEDALVKLGYVEESDISSLQAQDFGYDSINLDSIDIPQAVIALVPESVARENVVLPLRMDGDSIVVAINDPMKFEVIDKLRFILNREVKCEVATNDAILTSINRHYGQGESESVDSMLAEFTETAIDFTQTEIQEAETAAQSAGAEESSSPIIKLVNLIISEALNMRASDIHIEPFEDRIRIR